MHELHKHTLRDTLRRLAATPDGYDALNVKGFTHGQVASATEALKARGEVFPGHRTHKTVRYFSTQEAADIYAGAKPSEPPPVRMNPAKLRFAPDAKVVIPPHVKVQHGPSPQPSYRTSTYLE